jgi:hypothetical protein
LILGTSRQVQSSWPGLSRPSTSRRLNDKSEIASSGGKALGEQGLPSWPLVSKNLDALEHGNDRDEPGPDASVAQVLSDTNDPSSVTASACFT